MRWSTAVRWALFWACVPSKASRAIPIPSTTLARPGTSICDVCWCKRHSTFWDEMGRIRRCAGGDGNWPIRMRIEATRWMNEPANDARPKAKTKKPLLKEKSKAKAKTLTLTHTSRLIEAAEGDCGAHKESFGRL